MNISRMSSILLLAHKSNDSVHMMGVHGIGKSKIVESTATEHDFHCEVLMLAQNEVADLIGMPIVIDNVTYWSKPVWLKRMEDASIAGKHCILFLDELSRSPLEVRQSAMQLVLDGRIHEHHLPTKDNLKTLVVAADNPPELYQTDELDPALLDRFMTFNVEADIRGWLKWANDNNVESVIKDYLAEFPEKLHIQFDDRDNDKGATPRAWEKLSDVLKNIDSAPRDLLLPIFESKIGKTTANNFFMYFNDYMKIVKVEDIVEFINNRDISTEQTQISVGNDLKSITKDIEALSATQLANNMAKMIKEKKLDINVLTVFLGSLNLEITAGILKTWKTDKSTTEMYYSYADTVPNAWLFYRMTSKSV